MKKLFEPIDNAPLIVFRMLFGFLLAAEAWGAIATGWLSYTFVKPSFTFHHIGFGWYQGLLGPTMYGYYALMGLLGILVLLGYRYRWSLGGYTLLWAGAFLMQKESYNNHYYLLLLICFIMLLMPAHQYFSLDAKRNPSIKSLTMPRWVSIVMITQMSIVYFYATVAKFYPDWLDGTFTGLLFTPMKNAPLIGGILTEKWFHLFIAYSGIVFDGLIIPALLWKRTRTIAVIASLIFHLFNSASLKIGIFPYFALSFVVFFYEPETIRNLFLKKKPALVVENLKPNTYGKPWLLYFFIPYFIVQLLLPLRHWTIPGDVLWTEEGHRLSWRMMLRQRSGHVNFKVVEKGLSDTLYYPYHDKLNSKQLRMVSAYPDAIWQYAQKIKKVYQTEGKEVEIYIDAFARTNKSDYKRLIDPKIDFAQARWDYFFHNDWILLYDREGKLLEKTK
jgi:vitamin K-dependent gamma-carboxylase